MRVCVLAVAWRGLAGEHVTSKVTPGGWNPCRKLWRAPSGLVSGSDNPDRVLNRRRTSAALPSSMATTTGTTTSSRITPRISRATTTFCL